MGPQSMGEEASAPVKDQGAGGKPGQYYMITSRKRINAKHHSSCDTAFVTSSTAAPDFFTQGHYLVDPCQYPVGRGC